MDLIFNINKPLGLLHGDAYLVNFILKHWMDIFSSGNWQQLSTLPMFYGFENSLFFSDHHLIQALMALPFYLLTKDIIITSNLLIIATILLSFWSMYALAFYLTKKILPAILAAIIFVLNPFIFARFPDQLILFSLQWIPLIFLFFEKSIVKPTSKNLFFFFFFLACQLLSSLYYSVFLTIILPIYVTTRLYQEKVNPLRLINKGAVLGIIIFGITILASGFAYSQVFVKEPISRNLETVSIYSARPTDWLFTSDFNLLYGGLKEKAVQAFPSFVRLGIYAEQNLFPGLVPVILLLLSFKYISRSAYKLPRTESPQFSLKVYKKLQKTLPSDLTGHSAEDCNHLSIHPRHKMAGFSASDYKKIWLISVLLLVLSFLLSLGPDIIISDSFKIPNIYRIIYFFDPLFGFLRTSARFGVFAFFFLALIAALTLTKIEKKIAVFIIILILLEYWNKPLEFTEIDQSTKNFYQVLNKQDQIKVIVDLPIGNLIPYSFPQARAEDLDAHYLLWATILHDKLLLNGYTGFLPKKYYERSAYLSVNFPTAEKISKLRQWGVDGIILHKDEFNQTAEFDRIRNKLIELKVSQIAATGNLVLFDITGWK